jgi:hypothetical protein
MYALEMLYTSLWDTANKPAERAKLQAYKDMGFTIILRLDDAWGRTIPLKDDWVGRWNFARQCGEIAAMMKDIVDIYVIGNEMTTAAEERVRDAPWYAIVLNGNDENCAHDRIKANDPRALVLMGALSGWPGNVDLIGGMENTEWIRQVHRWVDRRPDGTPEIDGYALHAYSGVEYYNDPTSPTEDPRFSDRAGFRSFIEFLVPIHEAHGSNVPVFITETNTYWIPVNQESDLTYRQGWLREAFATVDQWNRSADLKVNALIWYTYSHFADPGNRDIWGNAMMRTDNQRLNAAREDLAWVTANRVYTPGRPGGVLRFEAENYTNSAEWILDNGVQGVDYNDLTPNNQGGAYRLGRHVQNRPDILALGPDNWAIGWMQPGEWLRYRTIAGGRAYRFVVRHARAAAGHDAIELKIGGAVVATASLPPTGGEAIFRETEGDTFVLADGHHFLQLHTRSGGSIIDWFELRPLSAAERLGEGWRLN